MDTTGRYIGGQVERVYYTTDSALASMLLDFCNALLAALQDDDGPTTDKAILAAIEEAAGPAVAALAEAKMRATTLAGPVLE